MQKQAAHPDRRLASIDVLRALAIIWVIAFHLAVNVGGLEAVDHHYTRLTSSIGDGDLAGASAALARLVLRLGYQGVPLFMMLSGFVLTYNTLLRERAEPLAAFYRNRVRALLTPYWIGFALTVGAIVLLAFARHLVDSDSLLRELRRNTYSGDAKYGVDGRLLLAGLALVPRGFKEEWLFAPSPSLWFVLVFVQFYAAFPLLLRLMRRIGPWPFAALALAATLAAKTPLTLGHDGYGLLFDWWIDSAYLPFNLFPFGLGMALAAVYARDRDALSRLVPGWMGAALVLYVGLLLHTGGSLAQGRSGLISVLSAPMIVLGLTLMVLPLVAHLDRPALPRAWRPLAWGGTLSYALLIASDPPQYVVGTMRTLDTPAWAWWAFCAAYAPVLVGGAWCVNRLAGSINVAPWRRGGRVAALYAAGAAGAALAGVGGVAIFTHSVDGDAEIPFHVERPVAAYLSQQICPLVGADGGGANIRGQDGGTTNVINGRSYWTFGDTVLQSGGLLPNGVAYSDDIDPSDCITLTHKKDAAGNAAPLLPKAAGEQTVWAAAGQVSLDGHTVYFPFESVQGSDYASGSYRFFGIGLAKFDTDTLAGTRVIEKLLTPADFPGEAFSLTPATDIVLDDGYAYLYIAVNWNVRVGRVPVASIEDRTAYRYWDGARWVEQPAEAIDILRTAGGQQGFNVAYDSYIGKWTALYSTNTLTSVAMAFADAPEGPYHDEVVAFDCKGLFGPGKAGSRLMVFPQLVNQYYCYHATRHPEYDANGGQTIYLTYGNIATYRLYLHRVVLGVPFVQWDAADGRSMLARAGTDVAGRARRGVAFYVPTEPAPGLAAVHDWSDAAGAYRYETASPGPAFEDKGVAFYAAADAQPGLEPVYRWDGGARFVYSSFDLSEHGYARGGIAFYARGLDEQSFYDPAGGYVYWVHTKGDSDFGCCGSLNNPTRQTRDTHADFTLAGDPSPAGYEAVVCSPVCGTNGKVIWSGGVTFSPNAKGGTLRLTPHGPE